MEGRKLLTQEVLSVHKLTGPPNPAVPDLQLSHCLLSRIRSVLGLNSHGGEAEAQDGEALTASEN